MSSLTDRFQQLRLYLNTSASSVNSKLGDQVFNLHYRPEEWSKFNNDFHLLLKNLREDDFTPHVVSFADICKEIFEESPIYKMQVKLEGMGSFSHEERNKTLYSILTGSSTGGELSLDAAIVKHIIDAIAEAQTLTKGVLILRDTEMLHPLFRVSAFEQILQGKFTVPTVICYPGVKGNIGDNPSFLGIYNADGNYRSTHIY